ncbi:MAG: DUF3068 domain-containing protein [Dehalococcoidia bacterium]|nr:MAG: DUF3068 domain-containing protein [Dehalococcoidia bacterium]
MAAQSKGLRGYRLIILAVVGAVLVIFGALWMSVIFPALDKVPTDYGNTYYFEGTFSVINPATMGMDSFPVEQTLTQEAVGTQEGALLIHEVRTVANSATGEDISSVYGDEGILAVNRSSLEFQQEIDEAGRRGQWGPPRPLAEGDSYDLWHPGAGKPLTANYMRSEDFRGLGVLVFKIDEVDIDIGTEPQSGVPLLLSTTIKQWVEPSSGTVVYNESITTTSVDFMGQKMPVQISELKYTEGTIAGMMDTARSAKWMLLWFRTLVPWIAIGFGCFLVGASAATVAIRSVRKAKAGKPVERPQTIHMDI